MKPYIKICTPCYRESFWLKSPAKACISTLINQPLSFMFDSLQAYGSRLTAQRNVLVNEGLSQSIFGQKLNNKYTHWLWVDSDIIFTKMSVEQLMAHDKDVISGVYRQKANPNLYEAWETGKNGVNLEYLSATTTGLRQISGGTGCGFLLCKREALERMEFPWFSENVIKMGDIAVLQAEDGYFSDNVRKAGLSYWVDCDCKVLHLNNN